MDSNEKYEKCFRMSKMKGKDWVIENPTGSASNLWLQATASFWAKSSEIFQWPSSISEWMGGEGFAGLTESAQKVYKLNFKQPSCEICFYKRLLYGRLVCYPCYNIAHTAYSIEQAFWILWLKNFSAVLAYSCPKHRSMAHHIRCMVHL